MDSKTFWLIVFTIGALAVGIGIYIYLKGKKEARERTRIDTKNALKMFGEPIYANTFSVEDIQNWASQYKEAMKNGGKALAAKVNNETFELMVRQMRDEGYSVDFNAHEYFSCIYLEAADASGKQLGRALVKYKSLTPILEQLLERGNGKFTIGG